MKRLIVFIIISMLLLSCKVNEKPKFIGVNSLEIVEATIKTFTIKTNLKFENKNSLGGTLQAKNIHVFIDSIDVATVNSEIFNVPKKSEFDIPLLVNIPFDKVYNNDKQSLLEGIMNIVSNKKIKLSYSGLISYKLGAFHYNYPLNYKQEISLKK